LLALAALLFARGLAHEEPTPPSRGPDIGFVHVEANVDAAAGGHAGLRIGPHVYHFLQTGDGTLRLTRVDWKGFLHVYAGLQNRSLYVSYLDLERDDAERLAASTAGAWIDEERDRAGVGRLATDAAWWAALRDGTSPPPLPGLGLLTAAGEEGEPGRALRTALCAALGEDFAAERLTWLDAAIDDAARAGTSLLVMRERCTEREVVRSIQRAAALDPAALIDVGDGAPLGETERRSLEQYLEHLRASVIALWASARPDRGRALAVVTARHHAVARSLTEGRLLLLDVFPDEARVVQPDADEAQLAYAPLHARMRAGLATVRAAVLDGDRPTEQAWSCLEEAASRSREARRGARGEPVRLADGRLLPARGRAVPLPQALPIAGAAGKAADSEVAWREAELSLRHRRDYSLTGRNCATELVRLLNGAFTDEDDARRALGACLVPGEDFAFVPWVLAREVRSGLRVRELEVVRSRRRAATEELERNGADAWTTWAEATTLTSTVYTPRAVDGWFLFFTDESVWSRPLLGAMNLAYGLLRGAVGALTWPFDGGKDLRAGFHGAFFSLPELVFGNVRKGTFAFVEADDSPARRY
jgi:hypothetical protein